MSYSGIMLKSALFCKRVKEYDTNQISYIDVFREIHSLGKMTFAIPVEWIGNAGKYKMTIEMFDSKNNLVNVYNNEFTLTGYSSWHDIVSYIVEFNEEGFYRFVIKCNGNIYLELPLKVSDENSGQDTKTIEYYLDYLK